MTGTLRTSSPPRSLGVCAAGSGRGLTACEFGTPNENRLFSWILRCFLCSSGATTRPSTIAFIGIDLRPSSIATNVLSPPGFVIERGRSVPPSRPLPLQAGASSVESFIVEGRREIFSFEFERRRASTDASVVAVITSKVGYDGCLLVIESGKFGEGCVIG